MEWNIIYWLYGGILGLFVGGLILYLALFHGESLISIASDERCLRNKPGRVCVSPFTHIIPIGLIELQLGACAIYTGLRKLLKSKQSTGETIQNKKPHQDAVKFIRTNLGQKRQILQWTTILAIGTPVVIYALLTIANIAANYFVYGMHLLFNSI